MNKQIFTIGYEIPGHSDDYVDFNSRKSLMDADIVLISSELLYPSYNGWVSFFSGGGGCYDVAASKKYEEQISHLKKEIEDSLKDGKNIFIFLSKEKDYQLASGTTSPRKGQTNYSTYTKTNYDFLPVSIGTLVSASGEHIKFSGNSIFSDFYKKFKNNLEYQLYIEDTDNAQVIFTGKDKTKILGAIYKAGNGNIVALPYLEYDSDKFTKYNKEDKSYWTDEAMKFGNELVNCFINIDQQLTQKTEKTPTPSWITKKDFTLNKVSSIEKTIQKNEKEIEKIKSKNTELKQKLAEENVLRDLLFEQGKPLENAVIKALQILGYQANNYDDGELELDQVIVSPEKQRFIGECEGKDNKDINITKFRQLLESLNADFVREEVDEKAFGILFGNPERLREPNKGSVSLLGYFQK
jgi:hypothetical protein